MITCGIPKTTYDIFPHEILDISCSDGRQGFILYPLGEIVNAYQQKFALSLPWSKGSDDIHPPLHKWPQGEDVVKIFKLLVR